MIQVKKCSPSEPLKKCVPKNSHSNLTRKSILLDRKNIFKLKLQQFYSKRKTVHGKIIRNYLVLQYFFIR